MLFYIHRNSNLIRLFVSTMATAMDLLGVFNELTEKIGEISTTSSSQLLLKSLKIVFPLLKSPPKAGDGRTSLTKAYVAAYLLVDLQVTLV